MDPRIELSGERALAAARAIMPRIDRTGGGRQTVAKTDSRALEGELTALEDAWREAEEMAARADDLTLPERIATWIERLRVRPRVEATPTSR